MIDVDMDTSTSDTMLLFANGAARRRADRRAAPGRGRLRAPRCARWRSSSRAISRATAKVPSTLIEVVVSGAASIADARIAARTVVSSPLVKTMVTGRDANLGRVLMALGRSGARIELDRTRVWIGELCAFEHGVAHTARLRRDLARDGRDPRCRSAQTSAWAAAQRDRVGLRPDRRIRAHQRRLHDVKKMGRRAEGLHAPALWNRSSGGFDADLLRRLAAGRLVSVTVKTPLSYLASTFSASTSSGSENERLKLPWKRSTRW